MNVTVNQKVVELTYKEILGLCPGTLVRAQDRTYVLIVDDPYANPPARVAVLLSKSPSMLKEHQGYVTFTKLGIAERLEFHLS